MKIDQTRVLLVGASGGMGQAMASQLRALGAELICVGRRWPQGMSADGVAADITQAQDRQVLSALAKAHRTNVVVIASGVSSFGPSSTLSDDAVEALIQTNTIAPIQLALRLLPGLLEQERAQLVFVGSALGRIGVPGFSAYGASKAAIHAFAEGLRRELLGSSVRVQVLAPRATHTPFNNEATQRFNAMTRTPCDSPEWVAQHLVALIESEAAERFIGYPEKLGVRINGVLGSHMDSSFAKHATALQSVFSNHAWEPSHD